MGRWVFLVIVMSLAGCASGPGPGEPIDASKYCLEGPPTDWSYCDWYYEQSYGCWMCEGTAD